MLDVRRLHVLKAVVDSGSVTAAAGALGYTPSAISQTLTVLEREVKTPLFEKIGRGLRPTPAALLLAGHAEKVATQLREAEAALEALRAGQSGRLRIAAFATAGASLVPRALAQFKGTHLRVEVDLVIEETEPALTSLRAGHIDVAVVAEHEQVGEQPGLVATHLLEDPYRVVLPQSHPAAARGSVELGGLRDDAWISTESARCNCLQTVTSACARAGFTPRVTINADEFATTLGFVAAGLGVAMVPLLALASVPKNVRVCKIRSNEPIRHVYAIVRSGRAGDPLVQAMLGSLHASAGAYLRSAA